VPVGDESLECLAGFGRGVVAQLVLDDVHDRLVEDWVRCWPTLKPIAAEYSSSGV
jgi:hypothetical protein